MAAKQICFGLSILFLATLGTAGGAHTQQNPRKESTVSVSTANSTLSQWGQFETVFTTLSQKYQTAIVCESAPLYPTLSPDAAAALQKTCAAPDVTEQEAITAVAHAYDYDAALVDKKTVLLTKRYSDPHDLPEITFDEAATFLNQLRDETKPFLAPLPFAPNLIAGLLRNTSPEKEAAYAKGVRWDALPPSFQKEFAYAQAWDGLSSSLKSIDDLANRLNGLRKPNRTVFKMASFQETLALAYEGPFHAPNATDLVIVSLNTNVRTTPGGGVAVTTSHDSTNDGNALSRPAVPTEADKSFLSKSLLQGQQTLKQWADAVNAGVSIKGGAKQDVLLRIEVPASIADKTVSLFGTETFLTSVQTVKAVAKTLGLRGGLGSDGIARLFLPTTRPLSDPGQIAAETLRLMPETLVRALKRQPGQAGFPQQPSEQVALDTAKADALYSVVVERLRKTVEPKLASNADHMLPLEAFSAKTKDALALSSLIGSADIFERLIQDQPTVWRRGVPASSSVIIVRKADGTLFQFSAPATNGNPGQSMNIVSGPISR